MTSNDTTHTNEKGTVCALNMFVQVQFFRESPAVLSLGELCEENGYSHEWYPGQPSYLKCKTDNHIPLVVPGVQAAAHPNQNSGRVEATTSCGWPRVQCGHKKYQNGFNHYGRIHEGIFKFYRRRPQRFLMKIKNLDCITDMRRNGFKVIHEKPKSAEETQRIPRELWRQEENPRSMNSDKSLLLHL